MRTRASAYGGQARGTFLVDSGANGNIVTDRVARELGHAPEGRASTSGMSAGGATHAWPPFTGTLAVGDSPAVVASFVVQPAAEVSGRPTAFVRSGTVGLPWMAGRRLLLAPDGAHLAFTDPKP